MPGSAKRLMCIIKLRIYTQDSNPENLDPYTAPWWNQLLPVASLGIQDTYSFLLTPARY